MTQPQPKIDALAISLFIGLMVVTFTSLVLAWATESPVWLGIPLVCIGGYYAFFNFKALFYLIVFCIPFSLELQLGGGFATDLPTEPLMGGLMLVFLLHLFLRKGNHNIEYLVHPISLLLAVHVFWLVITTIHSQEYFVSIKFILAKSWYILVFWGMAAMIVKNVKDFKIIFWLLFIPFTILIIVSLFRYSLLNFEFEYVNDHIMPYFRNKVNYASLIILFYPFLFVAAKWYPNGSWKKRIIQMAKILYLVGLYFSYTRSCFLGLIIGAVGLFVIHFRFMKPALVLAAVVIVAFSAYLIHKNKFMDYAPVFEKTVLHDRFEDHIGATLSLQDVSGMERLYRWIAGVKMSTAEPWVGVGPGNFYPLYKPYTVSSFETYESDNIERSTIHNYFLLLMVEQGYIGMIIFIILSILIFLYIEQTYHLARDKDVRRFILALGVSFIGFYVALMFSDLIEDDKTGTFFFMNLAILINLNIKLRRDRAKELKAKEALPSENGN